MGKTRKLTGMALEIEEHLRGVRQVLRRPVEAQFARGGLTGPQRSVMQALYHSEGLTLKELSRRVGLAHSTVSGIVDRLAARDLLERRPNEADRRATTIVVGKTVRDFMRDTLPAIAIHPIVAALERAEHSERAAILEGLRTLRRLL
jgi:DNA-binding MarR family transcriptional regulator